MKVFNDQTSSPDSVSSVGKQFLLALYGAPKTTTSLNVHRHKQFMKAVANCPVQLKQDTAGSFTTDICCSKGTFIQSLSPSVAVVRSGAATD